MPSGRQAHGAGRALAEEKKAPGTGTESGKEDVIVRRERCRGGDARRDGRARESGAEERDPSVPPPLEAGETRGSGDAFSLREAP
jgi:hypothetical protein